MHLTLDQIQLYGREGYLLLQGVFSPEEIDVLKAELPALFDEQSSRRVLEKDGKTVRSVYGCHQVNHVFERLTRHPKLLPLAQQIIRNDVYVYQLKVNAKAAFAGDVWEWHQDFIFWQREDGVLDSDLVNVTVFLDDVDEDNGPLMLIPGSHLGGIIQAASSGSEHEIAKNAVAGPADPKKPRWGSHVGASLKYSLNRDTVEQLTQCFGTIPALGPAGSVLLFDPNLVHGSARNKSGRHRRLIIITYNSVKNVPRTQTSRPEFLASRDRTPLTVLDSDLSGASRTTC